MKHGSLFSGIGGFDLAAQWMGWDNVFHCEWNDFGQRILKYYWPNAISYHDITKTDFTVHRGSIDILTGGFPCQPYSTAGKRLGKADERHLWPEMLRAIREIQPRWVVGENVLGLVNWSDGLVFDEVCAALETEGYEVQPFVLPASAVNAPHRRDRVWFVAYANIHGLAIAGKQPFIARKDFFGCGILPEGTTYDAADTEGQRTWEQQSKDSGGEDRRFDNDSEVRYAADAGNKGLQGSEIIASVRSGGSNGKKFSSGCVPSNWQNFSTVSPICDGNDGISDRLDGITFSKWRNESIKGGGNAIVPQVVLQIFKAIEEYESKHTS